MFSEGYAFQMVGQNHDKIFLDRNGDIFQYVLDFLRSERDSIPSFNNPDDEVKFRKELSFWDISISPHGIESKTHA